MSGLNNSYQGIPEPLGLEDYGREDAELLWEEETLGGIRCGKPISRGSHGQQETINVEG